MRLSLPAPEWALVRSQADKGEFIRSGVTYTVIDERIGPWSRDLPQAIKGRSLDGQEILIEQDLPLERLNQSEAQSLDAALRLKPGWRRRFFEEDAATWYTLDGHPVAVYVSDEGKRWAALLYRMASKGVQEIMLSRDVLLDQEVATLVQPATAAPREQLELF